MQPKKNLSPFLPATAPFFFFFFLVRGGWSAAILFGRRTDENVSGIRDTVPLHPNNFYCCTVQIVEMCDVFEFANVGHGILSTAVVQVLFTASI